MNNLGNNNHLNSDQPIPFDDADKPIPLGDGPSNDSPGVSRAPLNLGAGAGKPVPVPKPTPKPGPKPAAKPTPKIVTSTPITPKPTAPAVSGARITGVKTFFTKLHPGALEFLDDQITRWLKQNPEVSVKRTNVTTGDVQSKKTEPNIIISVWY